MKPRKEIVLCQLITIPAFVITNHRLNSKSQRHRVKSALYDLTALPVIRIDNDNKRDITFCERRR